jgi:predicted ABC-type ATPase
MAKERVALRVSKGGHHIPPDVIEKRYAAGITNFFNYILKVDRWRIYRNDQSPPEFIAEGERDSVAKNSVAKIYNFELWEKLRSR